LFNIKHISNRLSGLVLLIVAMAAPLSAADTLEVTLGEVLDYARGESPRVLASQSAARAAEGMELASLAGFLPHLKLSEEFSRGNDPVFAFGTRLRQSRFTQADFALGALNEPSPLTNYATRVLIQQPIFNGGKSMYGRKTASSYADAARSGSSAVTDHTLFAVKQAYYSVILARENLRVIEQAVKAGQSHAHQAKQMAATGLATKADELKASVRLAELEQQKIRVENMVQVAVENLKLASGWRTDEFLMPTDKLSDKEQNFKLDELTGYAMANQPALAAAEHAAEAAEYDARAAWGEVIPHLNGFFQYERDARDAFGNDGNNWMVGVSLDWYPFDGFGNIGKIRSKRAMREKAAYEAALAGHQVEVQVKEAWLGADATGRMVGVARSAVEQARESLRIVENQYAEGLATITDLLDTELAATNSELSLTQALYDYNVAQARLSLVTGGFPELN
jgi:outer membrane protein TolC